MTEQPDSLLELRGALEAGAAALVSDTLKTFTRLNAVVFQKDTPRVEIKVTIGSATGHKKVLQHDALVRFDQFNFTIAFTAVTRPNPNATQNNLHPDLVARVGNMAQTFAQTTWTDTTNFPRHYVAEALRDAGRPNTLKPEQGVEQTTLNYSGIICVRPGAWT